MVKMGYKEIKVKKYIEKFFHKVPHLYGKRNARKHLGPVTLVHRWYVLASDFVNQSLRRKSCAFPAQSVRWEGKIGLMKCAWQQNVLSSHILLRNVIYEHFRNI